MLDPAGQLAICCTVAGGVAVYDLAAAEGEGALLARSQGHSEMCTAAMLLEDMQHVRV